MAVGEGKFVLYSRIQPPLQAGQYRLTARQALTATGEHGTTGPGDLPVGQLQTHFRVRAPRYALPPDQVLSTFPPANAEGAFGSRLPQIVIRRRTLPWERHVGPGGTEPTPWLALVLIAEGEAELKLNQPIADCVTPGKTLEQAGEPVDAELGNYLLVRRSIVQKVFPTRKDVPLLAHAREVDIHDTELMMGDDDGFLAVVISNRLPLPGRDAEGNEVPIRYLACLINLEQQFETLLERAPPPSPVTVHPEMAVNLSLFTLPDWDRIRMGMSAFPDARVTSAAGPAMRAAASPTLDVAVTARGQVAVPHEGSAAWVSPAGPVRSSADVYAEMARPFASAKLTKLSPVEPVYRFPVLLHWSFTSTGQTTFRKLMTDLTSGLLGTTGAAAPAPDGRPPPEVVETGHVGLAHRTRRGDEVRVWYRGPLVPHPTRDPPGGRLPLAHAADQLRIVVPDGREDLSLAAAFEVGRLLALSRPSLVAALLRWRQLHYQAARREAVWWAHASFLQALQVQPDLRLADLGVLLGRGLAKVIAGRPVDFLGNPRPFVTPGCPLPLTVDPVKALATGLGLSATVLQGGPEAVLGRLATTRVPVAPAPSITATGGTKSTTGPLATGRAVLIRKLDLHLGRLVTDAFPGLEAAPGVPGAMRSRQPDALDRLLGALDEEEEEKE